MVLSVWVTVDDRQEEADARVPEAAAKSSGSGAAGVAANRAKERPQTLNPWEKYAQVLLLSNELVFVD